MTDSLPPHNQQLTNSMIVTWSPQGPKRFVYQVEDKGVFYKVELCSDKPECTCLRLQVNDHACA